MLLPLFLPVAFASTLPTTVAITSGSPSHFRCLPRCLPVAVTSPSPSRCVGSLLGVASPRPGVPICPFILPCRRSG